MNHFADIMNDSFALLMKRKVRWPSDMTIDQKISLHEKEIEYWKEQKEFDRCIKLQKKLEKLYLLKKKEKQGYLYMYYIVVDDDESIILTNLMSGNQIICKSVEYSIDAMNYGFVLADNKIVFEAGAVDGISDLDIVFSDSFTIQIVTENEE